MSSRWDLKLTDTHSRELAVEKNSRSWLQQQRAKSTIGHMKSHYIGTASLTRRKVNVTYQKIICSQDSVSFLNVSYASLNFKWNVLNVGNCLQNKFQVVETIRFLVKVIGLRLKKKQRKQKIRLISKTSYKSIDKHYALDIKYKSIQKYNVNVKIKKYKHKAKHHF